MPPRGLMAREAGLVDRRRRFGGVARLYGPEALERLAEAHVCVVGIGGVGSWAAEALVRSGVGRITLIDADHVAESNINRQVHALESTLGAAKVEVMRARLLDIAPDCRIDAIDAFVDDDNVQALLPADALVIDAIDAVRAKAALVAAASRAGQPIVVCGAAGGRRDPLQLRRADLARTTGDALLSSLRARLRRRHGFPRAGEFGVLAVHSAEALPLARPLKAPGSDVPGGDVPDGDVPDGDARGREASGAGAPLACAGYGSSVSVTAAMGLAAASILLPIALGVA